MLIQSLNHAIKPRLYNGFKSKAECKRAIFEQSGIVINSAFGKPESNPKIEKNMKSDVHTLPHNFIPAKASGFQVCPQASQGCIAACLHTAGNPVYMPAKEKARLNRTLAFFKARKAYIALMAFEIESHYNKCLKLGVKAGVRPNTTSDISWESVYFEDGKTLFDLFPNVSFYDYSKVTKRAVKHAKRLLPSNYHITFSRSESNDSDCLDVLQAGGNVAVVFDKLPDTWNGFPVIDGDLTDYRPSDDSGVVVGLKAKGDAKTDDSGFVVRTLAMA